MSVLDRLEGVELPAAVRDAVAADSVAAVIADSSRVLEATTPYLDLVGYSRPELEAGELSWMRLTPPSSLTADARAIGEARATGHARPYAKAYVRRDGSSVRVVLSLALLAIEPLLVFAVAAEESDQAARSLVDALTA